MHNRLYHRGVIAFAVLDDGIGVVLIWNGIKEPLNVLLNQFHVSFCEGS